MPVSKCQFFAFGLSSHFDHIAKLGAATVPKDAIRCSDLSYVAGLSLGFVRYSSLLLPGFVAAENGWRILVTSGLASRKQKDTWTWRVTRSRV